MASSGGKKENLRILEEIYHEDRSKKTPKKLSPWGYLQERHRIEKLLSGAIIIFSLTAIWLGFFQFNNQIKKNFLARISDAAKEETDGTDLLGQRTKDTDQDGLSDYDELNIYHSSPYLPDTDSDGLTDSEEVGRSSNPNCPEGQNCFAAWGESLSGLEGAEASSQNLLTDQKLQADELRDLLRQSGMSEEVLSQFSDEQLFMAYQEVAKQSQPLGSPQTSQTVNLPTQKIEDLTPDQIRELLSQAGVSKEILDKISEEDLMSMVKEILSPTQETTKPADSSTNQNQTNQGQ